MTTPLAPWLRAQLKPLPAVRGVASADSATPDALLVVKTWVGMRINIYALTTPPTVRALRRIVSDNTRAYQGTLLMLSSALLPPDGSRAAIPDWLTALHALYLGRVYTFSASAHPPALHPLHLEPLADGLEHEVWVGPNVPVAQLRTLKNSVHHGPLRGDWLVSDFGPDAFWRTADFRAGRFRQREARRVNSPPRSTTWGHYDVGGGAVGGTSPPPAGPLPRAAPPQDELTRAFALLGLARAATPDDVRAAFRRRAREVHPDVSTLDKTEAGAQFRALNAAYARIRAHQRW